MYTCMYVHARQAEARLFGASHVPQLQQMWGIEAAFSLPLLPELARSADTGVPLVVSQPDGDASPPAWSNPPSCRHHRQRRPPAARGALALAHGRPLGTLLAPSAHPLGPSRATAAPLCRAAPRVSSRRRPTRGRSSADPAACVGPGRAYLQLAEAVRRELDALKAVAKPTCMFSSEQQEVLVLLPGGGIQVRGGIRHYACA